jgi:hypothetical protein
MKNRTKRNSYAVICDEQFEEGLQDVDKVILLKNLGDKTSQLLYKHISCIMGVAHDIEETYGLSYDEILEVLQKKYNYEIVNKTEMFEPYTYGVFDTYYAWEYYAQKKEYADDCDKLEVNGVKELLSDIMNRQL